MSNANAVQAVGEGKEEGAHRQTVGQVNSAAGVQWDKH